MQSLTTVNYIPVKLTSKDTSKIYYKLFPINKTPGNKITETIKSSSTSEYAHFKLEGQYFPTFNFTDLNGIQYTNENTKGKYVVLNT